MADKTYCTIYDERVISLCHLWNDTLGRTHGGKGGGTRIASMSIFGTRQRTGTRVIIHSVEPSKKGTIANFCPWCGTSYAKANGHTYEGEEA